MWNGMWHVARCLWCELLQSKIGCTTRPTRPAPKDKRQRCRLRTLQQQQLLLQQQQQQHQQFLLLFLAAHQNFWCRTFFFFAFPYLFFVFISASFRTFNIPFGCFVFAFVVVVAVLVAVAVAVASSAHKLLSLFHFDFSFSCPLSSVPLHTVCGCWGYHSHSAVFLAIFTPKLTHLLLSILRLINCIVSWFWY